MSLLDVRSGASYLRRTSIYVDSIDRDLDKSKDNFTFTFSLQQEVRNVCGIELVQYQIPKLLTPTFRGKRDFFSVAAGNPLVLDREAASTNTEVDVRFTGVGGAGSLDFTFSFDPAWYSSSRARPLSGTSLNYADIQEAFKQTIAEYWAAAAAEAGSAISPANYDLVFNDYYFERLSVALQRKSDSEYGTVVFLNGTGTNAGQSSATVLGFRDGVDSVPDPTTGAAVADGMVNSFPFPYVELFVREFDEHSPFARIYTQDETVEGSIRPPGGALPPMRFLKRPIRQLKELSIRLRLPKGTKPSPAADVPVQLTFEVLTVDGTGSEELPGWLTTSLEF
jgi:hypothetical protein